MSMLWQQGRKLTEILQLISISPIMSFKAPMALVLKPGAPGRGGRPLDVPVLIGMAALMAVAMVIAVIAVMVESILSFRCSNS